MCWLEPNQIEHSVFKINFYGNNGISTNVERLYCSQESDLSDSRLGQWLVEPKTQNLWMIGLDKGWQVRAGVAVRGSLEHCWKLKVHWPEMCIHRPTCEGLTADEWGAASAVKQTSGPTCPAQAAMRASKQMHRTTDESDKFTDHSLWFHSYKVKKRGQNQWMTFYFNF